jgi:hypothetical protein
MVKKHLKGMEISIKEGEVEIKTLWKAPLLNFKFNSNTNATGSHIIHWH